MLTSLLGVRLILWAGDTVPTPAPPEALRALTHVEVQNDANGKNGFRLTFTLGKDKTGDFGLLSSGTFDPDKRVVIGVVMGVVPEALIDGIIYHHQVTPSNQPGLSTLTVMGRDISVMLDLEEKDVNHKNQPDFLIVNKILAQYALYVTPPYLVTPTTDVPIELQRVPHQSDTDLKFLQRMAKRNGFIFYIEPLLPGVNSAYWGPDTRLGIPLPALSMNLGDQTNVKTLQFSNDALAATGAEGSFVEPITKTSIKIPPLPSLRVPPLAASASAAKRIKRLRDTARQNPAQAAMSAVAAVTNAEDPVKGQGEVDSVRYGSILRARRLVGVRGAGLKYDGNYVVSHVTHSIEMAQGTYTQKFTLTREGTGALLPVVVP